jgi:hypothetical protein
MNRRDAVAARSAASAYEGDLRRDGYLLAAHDLAEPYPAEVFTPMTDDEIRAAVAAMNEAVPHASERMHAAWARHWSDVLRHKANEGAT